MNDKQYIGKRAGHFESHGDIRAVDGIALIVDEEHEFRAGDQTGYVMEVTCPYGTQAMADALLAQLQGRTYTSYTVDNAVMDPAAELGDGVTVGGIYAPLVSRQMVLGSGHLGQIAAPADSEMDHEYGVDDPVMRQIERKLAGTRSYIDKKSGEVKAGVESLVDERMSEIDVTLEGITGTVQGLDEQISIVEQKADSVTTTVQGLSGDVSELKQTATGLESSIKSANGEISTLKQTASSLTGRIESAEGDLTTLEATAKGLSTTVSGMWDNDTIASKITQSASNIKLKVSGSLGGEASISLSGGGGGSGKIDLSGVRKAWADDDTEVTINGGKVTFNTGTFKVSSDNLTIDPYGNLSANTAHLTYANITGNRSKNPGTGGPYDVAAAIDGNMYLFGESDTTSYALWGIPGADGSTSIPLVCGSTNTGFFGGANCAVLGWDCNVYINCGKNHSIKAPKSIDTSSDRDQKRDVVPLGRKYLDLLDRIPPVAFRYVGQPDDAPLALGYIAQDVEQALYDVGMTRADFAGVSGEDGTGCMALSYDDFIPILHLKINDLENRLRKLEERA